MYTFGLENLLGGDIDWDANNIKNVLIDEGTDAPNLATDDALDDIAAGARIATSGNLGSKTKTGGVADAADLTFSAVSGATVESGTHYKDSGTESTSLLICNHDTGTGLPVTPNGGDIIWSHNASGIFSLA
jgi:hypothetical protein